MLHPATGTHTFARHTPPRRFLKRRVPLSSCGQLVHGLLPCVGRAAHGNFLGRQVRATTRHSRAIDSVFGQVRHLAQRCPSLILHRGSSTSEASVSVDPRNPAFAQGLASRRPASAHTPASASLPPDEPASAILVRVEGILIPLILGADPQGQDPFGCDAT